MLAVSKLICKYVPFCTVNTSKITIIRESDFLSEASEKQPSTEFGFNIVKQLLNAAELFLEKERLDSKRRLNLNDQTQGWISTFDSCDYSCH